jgi:hypothetical protein
MRKYAILKEPINQVKKVMIYEYDVGVYVFLYDNEEDIPCFADHWYEYVQEAEDYCMEQLNISEDDWVVIGEPQDGNQHDLIQPIKTS